MPRLRHPSRALIGGVAAALALGVAAPAFAQTLAATSDTAQTAARLLQPVVDGDPREPPTFRKPLSGKDRKDKKKSSKPAASRFNGLPIFGPPPAAGAGTTGFDSLNRPRGKRRAGTATRSDGASRTDIRPLASTSQTSTQPNERAERLGLAPLGSASDAQSRARDRRTKAPAQATTGSVQRSTTLPRNAPPAASRAGAYGYAVPASATTSTTTTTPAAATGAITTTGAIASPRRRRPVEDDPFAPVGVRAGGFLLKPAVELTGGYDTNPANSGNPRGSTLHVIAPELMAQSLWSRHELTANVKGSYTAYGETPTFDRPNLDAKLNGRIDVRRDTRIDVEGRSTIATDNPGSPDLPTSVASLPLNFTYGTTAGLTQRFNRFELAAKGLIDRATYDDATLNNGSVVINKDRNYIQYGGALRGSYELTPGVKPFVEIGADRRVHDLAVDRSGFMRDSTGETARLGSTIELTRLLTGEMSAGYLRRHYEDPALPDLTGFIADASLVWTASALTNVKLTAKSSAAESTLADVSGVLTREAGIEVNHALRRWLIGTVKLNYGLDLYDGISREDTRYQASAALTYKLSRTLWFKGEFRQNWLRSTEPGTDYTASTFLLGLRWQR